MSSLPPQIPGASEAPHPRYKLALYGGGTEEVDRFQLRDRIRKGEVVSSTQLAAVGSNDWRPSSSFPELHRYLALAAEKRAASAPPQRPTAAPVDTRSMGERVIRGLVYPFTGQGIVVMGAYAFLGGMPFIGIFAMAMSTVYTLFVIRSSAEGSREMPPFSDLGGIFERIGLWFKVVIVSIVALSPMLAWIALWWTGTEQHLSRESLMTLLPGLAITFIISMVYYPACLAAVAVWDKIGDALNPKYVIRLITTMGPDYLLVIVMWIVTTTLAAFAAILLIPLILVIPFFGHVPMQMALLWAQYYNAHILGSALYKHADELGWD